MKRREVLALVGGAVAAWPFVARAQQKAMPVVGFLSGASLAPAAPFLAATRQGLGETGYVEGQNVAIEYRWAEGHYDRLPVLATDLVGRKVNVILAMADEAALTAKSATSTIPIVFIIGADPAASGLVASLARPGGNLTGVSLMFAELTAKRFELLAELVPKASVIALLVNPSNLQTEGVIRNVQDAARAKQVQLPILKASTEGEIDTAFATLVELHAGAIVIGPDPLFFIHHDKLVALALSRAVPAMYFGREFAVSGGLISYGSDVLAVYRQLGTYAGKILNGAKPADLPIEQPIKFELVVNLKTANTIGLTIPPSLLARADEVIE